MKWHYTILPWLEKIRRDGVIKPATAYIDPGEKPVVWFTTAPDWDPTANKNSVNPDGSLVYLDRAGTEKLYGLARIGVAAETAPHDWRALKELSGISYLTAQALYQTAVAKGSRPGLWWGSFDPVPREKWLAIQIYRDGAWVDAPGGAE